MMLAIVIEGKGGGGRRREEIRGGRGMSERE
jgi:hypothetical protein